MPFEKGHILTKDQRIKMSCSKLGRTPWNKGKKWSEETRKKMSYSASRRKNLSEIKKLESEEIRSISRKISEGKLPIRYQRFFHHGYAIITHPRVGYGCISEHKWIIENAIGRKLKKTEVSHHINGIKHDNRIKNLMLLSGKSAHLRIHRGGIPLPGEIVFDGRAL